MSTREDQMNDDATNRADESAMEDDGPPIKGGRGAAMEDEGPPIKGGNAAAMEDEGPPIKGGNA